jgi:hypothetical protein
MKKLLLMLCIICGLFLFASTVFADSPLTSTGFSAAYQDVGIVKSAGEAGKINSEIAGYLYDSKNPIDIKAAIINALSWDRSGKANTEAYTKMVYKKSVSQLKPESLSGDQLLCVGYLMAMDDYFDVANALKYLKMAEKKVSNSLTVSMIRALVESQDKINGEWNIVAPVLQNKNLKNDLRPDAVNIILDYMALDASTDNFKLSQNNFLIENETSQKVYLYGTASLFDNETPYRLTSQSDRASIALNKDQFGIYCLEITGIKNGNSSVSISNYGDKTQTVNFAVVSPDTYKKLNNTVSMYIGSTGALTGRTKSPVTAAQVPYLKSNRQYVPVDFLSRVIGAKVVFDAKKATYTITYSGKTIVLKTGSNKAVIGGKTVVLSSNAETKNKLLFITAQDFAKITGKSYIYYNGLIIFSNSKSAFNTSKDDYILNELCSLLDNGKSILNYPVLYQENGLYGYKDAKGKVVIKPKYINACDFSDGVAAVAIDKGQGEPLYGFINTSGEYVIAPKYDWANSFVGGTAPVIIGENSVFIDKKGALKISSKYGGVGSYNSGLAPVKESDGDKWGFIDTAGRLLIPYTYDDCSSFSEGLASVKIDGKWGFINTQGKTVIQPAFDDYAFFADGTADVGIEGESYTINRSSEFVCFFDNGDIFVGGSKDGLLDGKGVYTWADGSQYTGEFSKGVLDGQGVLTFPDGTTQEGYWQEGVYKGVTKE